MAASSNTIKQNSGVMIGVPANSSTYKAVNCGFYDYLLDVATKKSEVQIDYLDNTQVQKTITDVIVDVFTKQGAEYLKTQNQVVIQLDWLLNVTTDFIADKTNDSKSVKLKFGNCGINPNDDPCGDAIEY